MMAVPMVMVVMISIELVMMRILLTKVENTTYKGGGVQRERGGGGGWLHAVGSTQDILFRKKNSVRLAG